MSTNIFRWQRKGLVLRSFWALFLICVPLTGFAQENIAGQVWTWGFNMEGQLGYNTDIPHINSVPAQVIEMNDIADISAGAYHSMALKSDGTVWKWGAYEFWVGGGPVPNLQTGVSDVNAISGGGFHSIALKADGTVWTWGMNYLGQLGNGTNGIDTHSSVPVQVTGLDSIVAISAGYFYSMALKSDGTVWTWGSNSYGEIGNGTNADSNLPVQVLGLNGVMAISGKGFHSMALKGDGTVWTWGYNGNGELGNGTNADSNMPVQVIGLSDVTAIAAGGHHSIAIKADGTVWAWGFNGIGALGNGTNINSKVPVQVLVLSGVRAIAGAYGHSMAIKWDGTVWAWGSNGVGQLGDGTIDGPQNCIIGDYSYPCSMTPVQVIGLSNVIAMAGGASHSMAIVNIDANIMNVIRQFLTADCINNSGIANALTSRLSAARAAIKAGKSKEAINILSAFINQVKAQSGKHIASSCTVEGETINSAAVLINDITALIDNLKMSAVR